MYFYNYFDLDTNYATIVEDALKQNNNVLTTSATLGKGIRILNQQPFETTFSFIISQNNNIQRIKSSIEKLCALAGEEINSPFGEYYAFPTASRLRLSVSSDSRISSFSTNQFTWWWFTVSVFTIAVAQLP